MVPFLNYFAICYLISLLFEFFITYIINIPLCLEDYSFLKSYEARLKLLPILFFRSLYLPTLMYDFSIQEAPIAMSLSKSK